MREPPQPPRNKPFKAAGLLFAALAFAFWAADDGGRVERGGRDYRIPVPPLHLRIASSEGAATYLALGRRSLRGVLGEGESLYGFRLVEQMGSHHILLSDDDRLDVSERVTASVFTRFDYRLAPR